MLLFFIDQEMNKAPLLMKCLLGAIIITAIELLFGYIFNIKYGMKVWESYLENNTPGADRIFWAYGPKQGDITVIGLEPHPNDKSNAYKKTTLSQMGEEVK